MVSPGSFLLRRWIKEKRKGNLPHDLAGGRFSQLTKFSQLLVYRISRQSD